jgi:hypothetical protein
VEFSVEEVIARHQGTPWNELDANEQEAALKDYARSLFSRQTGQGGDMAVELEPGTFSRVEDKDV